MSSLIEAKVQRIGSNFDDCVWLDSCFPGHAAQTTHSRLLSTYLWLFWGYFHITLFTLHYLLWFPCKLEFQRKKNTFQIQHNTTMTMITTTTKNNQRERISSGVYGLRVTAIWRLPGDGLWRILRLLWNHLCSTCVFLLVLWPGQGKEVLLSSPNSRWATQGFRVAQSGYQC